MKTTIVFLMIASAAALFAETPRDLVFRGSKIEFSAHPLAAPSTQLPVKLQAGELSLGPKPSVAVPAGTNDLIAPPATRRDIIRRMQAVGSTNQPARARLAPHQPTLVPTTATDLIGTPADRDRILRDVKISDTQPAQP